MLINICGDLYNDKHIKAIEEHQKAEHQDNSGMSYLKIIWYDDGETKGGETEVMNGTIDRVFYPIGKTKQ